MKRILRSAAAAICILCLSFVLIFAEENAYYTDAKSSADYLYSLSLFDGTGKNEDGTPNYNLTKVPTREQAITMLIRLLGKEQEALTGNYSSPFSDISDWAVPYVGYAYQNGLTSGTSATTFSGLAPVSATQYLTFVLRALGYDDNAGDFKWSAAWELSDAIGLTAGEYDKQNNGSFTRSNMVLVSANALSCHSKESQASLYQTLDASGAIIRRAVPGVTAAEETKPAEPKPTATIDLSTPTEAEKTNNEPIVRSTPEEQPTPSYYTKKAYNGLKFSDDQNQWTYIVNVKSYKIHYLDCRKKPTVNGEIVCNTLDELIRLGYDPCGICKPR